MPSAGYATKVFVFLVSAALPFWVGGIVAFAATAKATPAPAPSQVTPPISDPTAQPAAPAKAKPTFFIQEYRVTGSKLLTPQQIGDVVYPFLGPGRTEDDINAASEALQKAYRDKGYNTVLVSIPAQTGRSGIIFLQVSELPVGRLRVKGSRYFSLDEIKKAVPSVAEGRVPNFNQFTKELTALNTWPDRQVTPELIPQGATPGTVDVNLNVKDTNPLHGSIELNNRYSPNTTPLRLNGSVSYDNLWQLGHGAGASFQISPEDLSQVKVISGYYLARLPGVEWLTLTLQGTDQDSNVSTLDSSAVAGKGYTVGMRAGIALPQLTNYVHSVTLGIDYKHFDQAVTLGTTGVTPATTTDTPVTYYPISLAYSGTWVDKDRHNPTTIDLGVYLSMRGTGSADVAFDNNRYLAQGNFLYFKGDLSHEHELPLGFQIFGKVQGQISDQPLISGEQFAAGGLSSVRGYLEGEVPGDNAIAGSLELRSPNLIDWVTSKPGEWRVYGFFDAAYVTISNPLPEQTSYWNLASVGVGSHLRLFDHLNGSFDAGLPLTTQTDTQANHWLLTFRVWGDF